MTQIVSGMRFAVNRERNNGEIKFEYIRTKVISNVLCCPYLLSCRYRLSDPFSNSHVSFLASLCPIEDKYGGKNEKEKYHSGSYKATRK